MNSIVKNILAVVAGVIVGSIVNMGLINISGSIIPPPPGVDVSDMESLKASMHLFEPKNFIFPFLAHALGTLAGAYVCALIAAGNKMRFAIAIGIFFLLGGVTNAYLLPAPLWFIILDITMAYFPMAMLGGYLASKK